MHVQKLIDTLILNKLKQRLESLKMRKDVQQDTNRLKDKIRELKSSPKMGNFLEGTNFRYIRIGDYRVIYELIVEDSKIIVLFIGHRKHVYTKFMSWFKK